MSRRVDPALTKRALSALKRAADKAKLSEEGLTEWEAEFLGSVEERLTKFGSAFADPDKGQLSAPLSLRQGLKVRQISKKGEAEGEKKPINWKAAAGIGIGSAAILGALIYANRNRGKDKYGFTPPFVPSVSRDLCMA